MSSEKTSYPIIDLTLDSEDEQQEAVIMQRIREMRNNKPEVHHVSVVAKMTAQVVNPFIRDQEEVLQPPPPTVRIPVVGTSLQLETDHQLGSPKSPEYSDVTPAESSSSSSSLSTFSDDDFKRIREESKKRKRIVYGRKNAKVAKLELTAKIANNPVLGAYVQQYYDTGLKMKHLEDKLKSDFNLDTKTSLKPILRKMIEEEKKNN